MMHVTYPRTVKKKGGVRVHVCVCVCVCRMKEEGGRDTNTELTG